MVEKKHGNIIKQRQAKGKEGKAKRTKPATSNICAAKAGTDS